MNTYSFLFLSNAVNAFNLQNKTAIEARGILQETAKVSKDLGARFAFNTTEIAKAVTEAKNLGLTLSEVSSVADNLLQFESSLEEAKIRAKNKIEELKEIKNDILLICLMQTNDLATLRHIFFRIEEDYMIDHLESVMSLWSKIFQIEEIRNPEIRLTLNLS